MSSEQSYVGEKEMLIIRDSLRTAIHYAVRQGKMLQTIKQHEPLPRWQEALTKIGVDEVHARYLLNLVDEYGQFIKNGGSHWECMDKFLADGGGDKLVGFMFKPS